MKSSAHTVIQDACNNLQRACAEVERQVVGQRIVIRHAMAACIAGGHILFEDVPGTGKTTLASAIASVLGLRFSRVQGTPDLLPADVIGTLVFHPGTGEFNFREGPVFTQLLLMDEINRATPRTQSALLEAMAEGTVSVDGQTKHLQVPFIVMATANPLESQGVFPLPEAQLDRFLVQLQLGYTSEEEEYEMVTRIRLNQTVSLQPQMSPSQVLHARDAVRRIEVADDVLRYIVQLCRATRKHEQVSLGASPRSILSLTAFSQALALMAGRTYILPDDVQDAWIPVMRHRIRTQVDWRTAANANEVIPVLKNILQSVIAPVEFAAEANS